MGILDEIERKGREKNRKRGHKDLESLLMFLENYNAEGWDDLLSEIDELRESDRYVEFMNAFRLEAYAEGKRAFTMDELFHNRALKLARENLYFGGLINSIFTRSLVTSKQFITINLMIDYTYVTYSGRTTGWDDILNIYFSRLDEHLMFAMDKFDQIRLEDLPEPTPEYFQSLKKLKWKDKNTEKLSKKLTEYLHEIAKFILNYPSFDQAVGWLSTYSVTEGLFIQTLAGCSAVNNNQQKIEDQGIIKAYKTFFKLMKTDVTKYKAIPELVQDIDGY